jgi:hypothetical protein
MTLPPPFAKFEGQLVFKVFGVFDWEAIPGYSVAFNEEGTNQGSVHLQGATL